MNISILEYISNLDKKRQEFINQRTEAIILEELYPDLQIAYESHGNLYTTQLINSKVDSYINIKQVGHLLVKFFKKITVQKKDVFIYTNPLYIDIGSYNQFKKWNLKYNWKEILLNNNINIKLIKKIGKDFNGI